jgi:hypothetical protein
MQASTSTGRATFLLATAPASHPEPQPTAPFPMPRPLTAKRPDSLSTAPQVMWGKAPWRGRGLWDSWG